MRRWENYIEIEIKKQDGRVWNGYINIKVWTSDRVCEKLTCGLHKTGGIY